MFFIEAKSNFAKSETMLGQTDVKFKWNKETDKSITVNMSVYEAHKETTGFGSITKSEKKSSKKRKKTTERKRGWVASLVVLFSSAE